MTALLLVRLLGWDAGTWLALPIAGLPLVVVGTVVLLGILLTARRLRRLAAWCAVLVTVQVALLAPRFVADGAAPDAGAAALRVGTVNADRGRVDPQRLVDVVRSERLDVLAVQELPTAGVRALDEAGLREFMPYRELHPEADSSIYAGRPLVTGGLLDAPTSWPQTTAEVVAGGRRVRLIAVHTYYPAGDPVRWTRDLAALADEAAVAGPDLVLLGDLNGTVDHAPVRALLAAGLVDSHAELGRGWAPTWPADGALPPLVQLDHVLHGPGLATRSAHEITLPGTDHRMVVAELAVRPGHRDPLTRPGLAHLPLQDARTRPQVGRRPGGAQVTGRVRRRRALRVRPHARPPRRFRGD